MHKSSLIAKPLPHKHIIGVIKFAFAKNTEVKEIKLLQGGLFNTTYYIATEFPSQKIVIRFAPTKYDLLYSFEKTMMAYEAEFYNLLKKNNIPTQDVIAYNNRENPSHREFVICNYIDAIPLNSGFVPKEQKPAIAHEVGKHVRAIHNIRENYFGWPYIENDKGKFSTWYEFIFNFVEEIAERADRFKLFEKDIINKLLTVIIRYKKILNEIKIPYLIHTDLWDGNILVSKDNDGIYKLASIIDADRMLYGDPDLDFAPGWYLSESYLKGYGKELDTSQNNKLRRKIYCMIIDFFNADVNLIQYNSMQAYSDIKEKVIINLNEIYNE